MAAPFVILRASEESHSGNGLGQILHFVQDDKQARPVGTGHCLPTLRLIGRIGPISPISRISQMESAIEREWVSS